MIPPWHLSGLPCENVLNIMGYYNTVYVGLPVCNTVHVQHRTFTVLSSSSVADIYSFCAALTVHVSGEVRFWEVIWLYCIVQAFKMCQWEVKCTLTLKFSWFVLIIFLSFLKCKLKVQPKGCQTWTKTWQRGCENDYSCHKTLSNYFSNLIKFNNPLALVSSTLCFQQQINCILRPKKY